jgi:hypothetical protein
MYKVNHYSYCGMTLPVYDGDDETFARNVAAKILKKRRNENYPIKILERGIKWEVMEPENIFLIPDSCGILKIDFIPELDDENFDEVDY